MAVIVQKYGGTSVQDHELVLRVAHRVAGLRSQGNDVVVVVSARGETTDRLMQEARRFTDAPEQRELDMLMSAGERISMSLLAIALNSIGCAAVSFTGSQAGIITDTRHTDARVLEVRPFRVVRELERGNVVVVGGFQGVSTAKDVTTLGRGGSDTTAVALAAALKADLCEILTDVDAVYTADPRIVPDARAIDEIGYGDMAELARLGARILKEEAVRFAERSGIAIHIAGSNSDAPGTIVLKEPHGQEPAIVGLSLLEDQIFLSVRRADHDRMTSWMKATAHPLFVVHSGDRIEIVVSGLPPGVVVPQTGESGGRNNKDILMQDRKKGADEFETPRSDTTNIDEFARNMVRLFDQGTKVFSTLAERTNTNGNGPYSMASEVGEPRVIEPPVPFSLLLEWLNCSGAAVLPSARSSVTVSGASVAAKRTPPL